ncbi:hypothetical protein ONV78_26220 [Hahella sp. CR1]|uniref:hypothetical protein n=1 Tax=Hahella sp. CR1 TaxID=2992807 RepID=UPI0024426BD5|nr:hypothetical protein [Hahella sp. CR1]MDG9671257.1 hypothetical protein [Hahella sp. CR1]
MDLEVHRLTADCKVVREICLAWLLLYHMLYGGFRQLQTFSMVVVLVPLDNAAIRFLTNAAIKPLD